MNEAPCAMVLVPFGSEFLALSPVQLHEALERGRELMPNKAQSAPAHADDRIVDAEGAAVITGVPASWFEEQARRNTIPHLRFGKYPRFRVSEVLEAVTVQRGTTTMRRKSA
jgi:hypothetical protein